MKCKEPTKSCHPTGWPAGRPMTIKEAQAITHTLSKPGKMPGFAYSQHQLTSARLGTKLRDIPKSVSVLIVTRICAAGIDFKMLSMRSINASGH